jgi:ABC-type Mn2+/Zn2+ transport system permease subunit
MKKAELDQQRVVLKVILNFWTFVTMVLFVLDFFSGNQYNSTSSAIGLIYLSVLGIYASEKEYVRWKNKFASQFFGEFFIVTWTTIMLIFVATAPFSNGNLRVPGEFVVVYTSVVGVFAITQYSKKLRNLK